MTFLMVFVFSVAAMAQTSGHNEPKKTIELTPAGTPVMELEEDEHNFGKVYEGEKVKHVFTFVNTGDAPLIIEKTGKSCGCTVPSFSKEPVMPGDTGKITVEFNSMGKHGAQVKTVTVHYNNMERSPTLITIKCMVVDRQD